MVHDAVDESRGTGGVGKDGRPVAKHQVGGEHQALLLVTFADDLKEQVCVAVVEGEEADFVDDEQGDAGVVAKF